MPVHGCPPAKRRAPGPASGWCPGGSRTRLGSRPQGGSSVGQSRGLIILGSWVRAPPALRSADPRRELSLAGDEEAVALLLELQATLLRARLARRGHVVDRVRRGQRPGIGLDGPRRRRLY